MVNGFGSPVLGAVHSEISQRVAGAPDADRPVRCLRRTFLYTGRQMAMLGFAARPGCHVAAAHRLFLSRSAGRSVAAKWAEALGGHRPGAGADRSQIEAARQHAELAAGTV
jgi:hypothetical protein